MARKTAASLKTRPTMGAAAQVAARINQQMERSIIRMASDDKYLIRRVPTGSLVLDRLTNGGFARGRHVVLYGDWMVGKSLIAYMTMVLAQQRGEVCAVLDPESIFNSAWYAELGGSINDLLMPDLANAMEAGNVLRAMEQRPEGLPAVDIVLVDSVASLLTKEEQDYDWESGKDARTASLARYMSMLLRQITMANDNTLFIWTNQWRDKISHIPGLRSKPGGRALDFYASHMVEFVQGEKETEERMIASKGRETKRKVVLGRWVNLRMAKEKTGGRPEDTGAFMLNYDTGRIDYAREIVDLGMRDGIIKRQGDYYVVFEDTRYHGIKRTLAAIEGDEDLRDVLVDAITAKTTEADDG